MPRGRDDYFRNSIILKHINSMITPEIELRLSEMAEGLVGSEIIKLAGEVKAKVAAGESIANLTIGDFNPAVTIMLIAAGKQPVNVAVPFIIAQIMAGLAAVEIHKRM